MVQGLQLSTRLTQSLVLAPQLQQSLALLQAPTLELKALVEQELQQNPVLEEVEGSELDLPEKPVDDRAIRATPWPRPIRPSAPMMCRRMPTSTRPNLHRWMIFRRNLTSWCNGPGMARSFFPDERSPIRQTTEDEERRQFMFDSLTAGTSFSQVLMDQARESDLTDDQRGHRRTDHRQH